MKSNLPTTLGDDLLEVVGDRNFQPGIRPAAEDFLQNNIQRRGRLNSWKSAENLARNRRCSEFNLGISVNNEESTKKKLIDAYKTKNYQEFVKIMQTEYDADEANIPENEMKIVLLEVLLLSPMEEEIFKMIKEDLIYFQDEEDFKYLLEIALDQPFYSNFHQLVLLNNNVMTTKTQTLGELIEEFMMKQLGITKFEDFRFHPETPPSNLQINCLKYMIFFEKIKFENQLMLINDVKHLEFFDLLLDLMCRRKTNILVKLERYENSLKDLYTPEEAKSLFNVYCNFYILQVFSSYMRDVFERLICWPSIDINKMMVPRDDGTSQLPLIFYIADNGYCNFLKIIFDSGKRVDSVYRDPNGGTISLGFMCAQNYRCSKWKNIHLDLIVDYDRCLSLIGKHVSPCLLNNKFVTINYIPRAGVYLQCKTEATSKTLKKFLDSCVSRSNDGIQVDYWFMEFPWMENSEENEADNIVDFVIKKNMKEIFQHPVLHNYIEVKYSRLLLLHLFEFLRYFMFYVAFTILGFFYNSLECLTVAQIYLALRIFLRLSSIYRCNVKRKKSMPPLICDIILFVMNLLAIYAIFVQNLVNLNFCFTVIIIVLITNLIIFQSVVFPPIIANYFMILEKVTYTTMKALLSYMWIILILSFALQIAFSGSQDDSLESNSTLFDPYNFNRFSNFWFSFVKTLAMLTGEYDAGSLAFRESNIILFFFFLLVAIILYNLINALAVADVKEIRENADQINLMKKWERTEDFYFHKQILLFPQIFRFFSPREIPLKVIYTSNLFKNGKKMKVSDNYIRIDQNKMDDLAQSLDSVQNENKNPNYQMETKLMALSLDSEQNSQQIGQIEMKLNELVSVQKHQLEEILNELKSVKEKLEKINGTDQPKIIEKPNLNYLKL